jgi:tellurite resistance protein
MAIKVTDLRHVGAERLGKAVQLMIERQSAGPTSRHRLPGPDQLRAGADATRGGADDQQARTFQSILELGYLVASADGFAEEERSALAALLEQATGAAVNREELELHFRDLDEGVAMLGRRERLRRAAADFDDALGRTHAITFTALIAVADGVLGQPEIEALAELGKCFELPLAEVLEIVEGVAREVEHTVEAEALQ